ncbi:hypothetical protein ABZV75_09875 [Streptomyces flaveolus]|uniref:hypothetical protein n=1 Tax=Streptomyces flaveolus TaxID=67297 RepID=UPI0033A92970
MTHPNVFVVVVIAGLTGNQPLEQVAIRALLPMSVLSFSDSFHTRHLGPRPDDPRRPTVLGLNDRPSAERHAPYPSAPLKTRCPALREELTLSAPPASLTPRPLLFWTGVALACAGVAEHLWMFIDSASMDFHMA